MVFISYECSFPLTVLSAYSPDSFCLIASSVSPLFILLLLHNLFLPFSYVMLCSSSFLYMYLLRTFPFPSLPLLSLLLIFPPHSSFSFLLFLFPPFLHFPHFYFLPTLSSLLIFFSPFLSFLLSSPPFLSFLLLFHPFSSFALASLFPPLSTLLFFFSFSSVFSPFPLSTLLHFFPLILLSYFSSLILSFPPFFSSSLISLPILFFSYLLYTPFPHSCFSSIIFLLVCHSRAAELAG
ncbi:hypothetical protein XELAEV_18046857mg [Xenopus laevis]|uniref:Uncharacterized protein n=1 Tax=Xenopus laevis TaxID=8355 RepID=A0A974BU50_XENLA|nr:hypothetical protein XELAEV_18046857mg [Xenopus laevis]